MFRNRLLFLVLVAGVLTIWFVIVTDKVVCDSLHKNTKIIVYWTPYAGRDDMWIGFGAEPFAKCEFSNCFATNNKTFLVEDQFDAIIYYIYYQRRINASWPKLRSSHQRHIFMDFETPVHANVNFRKFDNYFNWTMSYRFDSDIVKRHAYVIPTNTTNKKNKDLNVAQKTKMVAWIVSNCNSHNGREHIAKLLQKYVQVDIYGKCGTFKCPITPDSLKFTCYEELAKQYKFYLSFENSHCVDYATEKLYIPLESGMVPIVYGGGNYSKMAPPYSVIEVGKFKTVKDLANYLIFLDQNPDEYKKYFKWRRQYVIERKSAACDLCKKLNDNTEPPKVIRNINEWMWGANNENCKIKQQLPRIT